MQIILLSNKVLPSVWQICRFLVTKVSLRSLETLWPLWPISNSPISTMLIFISTDCIDNVGHPKNHPNWVKNQSFPDLKWERSRNSAKTHERICEILMRVSSSFPIQLCQNLRGLNIFKDALPCNTCKTPLSAISISYIACISDLQYKSRGRNLTGI